MCKIEVEYTCVLDMSDKSYCEKCGDGIKKPTEDCDDQNKIPNDGCSASCKK